MLDSLVRVSRRVEKNHLVNVLDKEHFSLGLGRSTLKVQLTFHLDFQPPTHSYIAAWTVTRTPRTPQRTRVDKHISPSTQYMLTTNCKKHPQPTTSNSATPLRDDTPNQFRLQQSYNKKLVSFASLFAISRTFNPLSKVLFTFPSRYLFAIGLESIFSFRRNAPPV